MPVVWVLGLDVLGEFWAVSRHNIVWSIELDEIGS